MIFNAFLPNCFPLYDLHVLNIAIISHGPNLKNGYHGSHYLFQAWTKIALYWDILDYKDIFKEISALSLNSQPKIMLNCNFFGFMRSANIYFQSDM